MASIKTRPNIEVLKLFTVEELLKELLRRGTTLDEIVSRVTDFFTKNTKKTQKNCETNHKSTYEIDKEFEENSAKVIKPILKDLKSPGFIKDRETQLKGIDFKCIFNEKEINVDAKAIATNDWPTFCFEVAGNIHSGQVGWLIKKDLLTDHYLIVYHDVADYGRNYKEAKKNMTVENVNLTEAYLINKADLMELIQSHIHSNIQDVVKKIRNMRDVYKKETSPFKFRVKNGEVAPFTTKEEWSKYKPKIWFAISPHIYEQPINIVIKRELLASIAIKYWKF